MFNYNNSGIGGNVMKNLNNIENLEKEIVKTLEANKPIEALNVVMELIGIASTIVNEIYKKCPDELKEELLFTTSQSMKMHIDRYLNTTETKH